jgi:hypothetical protein
MDGLLAEAGRDGRAAAIMELSDPEAPVFRAAETWRSGLPGLTPAPWAPTPETLEAAAQMLGEDGFETRWFSDGLAHDGRDVLLEALEARGPVTVHESARPVLALRPAQLSDGLVDLTALRAAPGGTREITVNAHGLDPAGIPRVLASLPMTFEEDATEATGALSLPPELRARVTRFEIAGETQAGAVTLTDDGLKRREVALIAGREDREGLELLSPLHYLEQALVPTADLLDGALMDVLPANPDVIVLADVATLSGAEQAALLEWAEAGGLLLRFAGPRVAASDVSRSEEAPLMPVRPPARRSWHSPTRRWPSG